MAVTLASADSALKSVYLDVVSEQLNTNANPFLATIRKTTDDVWGKEVRKLVTYGLNTGVGAGTEDGNLPTATGNKYKQFVLPLKNLYGTLEISDKAIRASANSEGAFVNLLNAEMEGLVKASSLNFGRMLFGDGSGVIGTVDSVMADRITVNGSLKGIEAGMTVDFMDEDGNFIEGVESRKIVSVDKENNDIYVSGTAVEDVLGSGTLIVRHNAFGNEITGLKKIFDIEGEELYGVDRASNDWINPIVSYATTNFSEMDLQKMIDQIEEKSGATPNFIICSMGVRRTLQKMFQENNTRTDVMNLNGGYKAISYNGIPIVADRCCPEKTLYLLNTDDFCLHQLCDWQWLNDDDGRVLKQVPGKPVYTATLVKYAELLCSRPCGQGMITNITEI